MLKKIHALHTTKTENKLCPYIENPSKSCYCTSLNSMKILLVVEYCMNNYYKCPIFQKLPGEQRRG